MKSIVLLPLLISSILALEQVKDGGLYQLTNSLDNNVLTVTSQEMEVGSNITFQEWKDQASQKFLTVLAKQGENDHYLLVPRRQLFDWVNFTAEGNSTNGTLTNRLKDLTNTTLVLSVRTKGQKKFVTQEYKNDKLSQQWEFSKVGTTGKYLLRNVDTDLCIKNPGLPKKHGVLQKLKSSVKGVLHHGKDKESKHPIVEMVGCNRDEIGQQFSLEGHV